MKPPTPPQLAGTPELAPLAIVHQALDVTVAALIATNPQLVDHERPYWVNEPAPSCHLAHVILALATQLQRACEDYRAARVCELDGHCHPTGRDDDFLS